MQRWDHTDFPDQPGPIARLAAHDCRKALGVRAATGPDAGRAVAVSEAAPPPASPRAPCGLKFVQFRLRQAATELRKPIPADYPLADASVGLLTAWAKKHGLFLPRDNVRRQPMLVRQGDLLIMAFQHHVPQHVGFLMGYELQTIEANPADGPGDQPQGVFQRSRTWDEVGAAGGILRLPF